MLGNPSIDRPVTNPCDERVKGTEYVKRTLGGSGGKVCDQWSDATPGSST